MKTSLNTNILSSLWLNEQTAPQIAEAMAMAKRAGMLIVSAPVYSESLAHLFYTEEQVLLFYAKSGLPLISLLVKTCGLRLAVVMRYMPNASRRYFKRDHVRLSRTLSLALMLFFGATG